MEKESDVILVTGASGFIASHIVQQLLQEGHKVRGTVRSLENESKVKFLKELVPEAENPLELVEADLTKPESWESAVKDCTYVVHVASPFPSCVPKEPETELINPAVEGTTNILKAVQAAKTVKRMVITSSIQAVLGGETGVDTTKTYTEEDWANVDKIDSYSKSKTQAEKAAYEFIKELPEEERFEIATILPGYVMGPVLHNSMCTSMEIPKKLLERAMPGVPKLSFNVVDVRDVAAAHIKALTAAEAAGNRHIVTGHPMLMKDIALIMAEEYKPQGYCVPTWQLPYVAVWVKGMFDPTVKMIRPMVGKAYKIENKRMKDVLGIEPREPKETILDMCNSMIEGGWIKKPKPKKEKTPKGGKKDDEAVAENHVAEGSGEVDKKEDEEKKEEVTDDKKEEETKDEPTKEDSEQKEGEKTEETQEEKPEEKIEDK